MVLYLGEAPHVGEVQHVVWLVWLYYALGESTTYSMALHLGKFNIVWFCTQACVNISELAPLDAVDTKDFVWFHFGLMTSLLRRQISKVCYFSSYRLIDTP